MAATQCQERCTCSTTVLQWVGHRGLRCPLESGMASSGPFRGYNTPVSCHNPPGKGKGSREGNIGQGGRGRAQGGQGRVQGKGSKWRSAYWRRPTADQNTPRYHTKPRLDHNYNHNHKKQLAGNSAAATTPHDQCSSVGYRVHPESAMVVDFVFKSGPAWRRGSN